MMVNLSDLDSLKDNALKSFDERVAKADLADHQAIEREIIRLESQLEQLYSFTALMARREPDMAETAKLWARLVNICDVFAARAYQLSARSPLGGSAYDSMLDIRAAAEELRALHSP